MKKKLRIYIIVGILFASILGTLMHFVYEWTGNNFIVGLIAPVSESTWEHMKLLFFPMLFYSIFLCLKLKEEFPCVIPACALGIIVGTFCIPAIFYTYSGILGTNYLVLDILTLYVSIIIGFLIVYYVTLKQTCGKYTPFLIAVVVLLMLSFFIFTSYPPNLGLFQNP